jgi:hypothetical protein
MDAAARTYETSNPDEAASRETAGCVRSSAAPWFGARSINDADAPALGRSCNDRVATAAHS